MIFSKKTISKRLPGTINKKIVSCFLRLKHCYPADFSHKPLCSRFKDNVLKIGKVFLCRSCVFLYTGIISGGPGILLFRDWFTQNFFILFVLLLLPVFLSYPRVYNKMPRFARDILRFGSGIFMALLLLSWLPMGIPFFIIALSIFTGLYFVYRHLRKKDFHRLCEGCNEHGQGKICSGFTYKAQLIRNFEKAYEDYLYRKFYIHS